MVKKQGCLKEKNQEGQEEKEKNDDLKCELKKQLKRKGFDNARSLFNKQKENFQGMEQLPRI